PTVNAVTFTSSTVNPTVVLTSATGGSWTFTGSTISAAGNPFINATGATTTLTASTMQGGINNQGTLIVQGASGLPTGSTTFFASGTVRIQGTSTASNATLTLPGAQSNAGLIDLTSTGGAFNASLVLTVGALTNTGTITSSVGTLGGRTITARVINQNVLTVN